jgi:hypothetical protein
VAAGAFADPRGGVEVLALAGTRALLYNVLGNQWVGQGIEVPPTVTLAPPIGTLREDAGRARAVARGAGNQIVVFSIRGMFTSCTAEAAGPPVEVRGIDIEHDGVDEVAVLFADGGPRSLQMFRVTGSPNCTLEPVLADVLEGCVDVADAGAGLVAICRRPEDGDTGPARGIYTLVRRGDGFERSPAGPIAQVPGDGRFLTAGDYDGDGVLDVAVSVHRVDSVGIQLLRQCPRHDTRDCRAPR